VVVRRGESERAKRVKKESVRKGKRERRERRESRGRREKREKRGGGKKKKRKEGRRRAKAKKGSYSVTVPTRHLAVILVSHATRRIKKEGGCVEFQFIVCRQKRCHLDTLGRQITSSLDRTGDFKEI